jgi:NADPH:quinone reductase-like Zn-dependent oxidoreductase
LSVRSPNYTIEAASTVHSPNYQEVAPMKAVQYERFITPKVDEVLPLAMAAEAHRRLEHRSVRGVIVLDPTVGSEGNA